MVQCDGHCPRQTRARSPICPPRHRQDCGVRTAFKRRNGATYEAPGHRHHQRPAHVVHACYKVMASCQLLASEEGGRFNRHIPSRENSQPGDRLAKNALGNKRSEEREGRMEGEGGGLQLVPGICMATVEQVRIMCIQNAIRIRSVRGRGCGRGRTLEMRFRFPRKTRRPARACHLPLQPRKAGLPRWGSSGSASS